VRTVEKVLVSIGRRPNVLPGELAKLGVKAIKKGIKVDSHMRTTRKGVYAVGDVTGKVMLAHVAFSQGIVAAENIMGKTTEIKYDAVPNCIFTIPEIASVGVKEGEVSGARVGRFFLAASGKAKASGRSEGVVKVVIDGKTEKILGTHIIGSHASDIISEAVLAISIGATAEDVLNTMHAHPTLSEAFAEAIKDAAGRRCILKRPTKKPAGAS